jgi:hypothetical protein
MVVLALIRCFQFMRKLLFFVLLICLIPIYAMILLDSTASGALHCGINNGGCWKKTQDGRTYSACVVSS